MSNFAPIDRHFPELAQLGRLAEAAFSEDPRATMSHLRVWGEKLSVRMLDVYRLSVYSESQIDRIRRLSREGVGHRVVDDLHTLRTEGNKAVHAWGRVDHRTAMSMLHASARLVRWLWQDFTSKEPPKPASFQKPAAGSARGKAAVLEAQLEEEKRQRQKAASEVDDLLRLMNMPQVATWAGVEGCFQQLDDDLQERVGLFLKLFREEPLNEEWPLLRPEGMADDKVRFVEVHGLVVVVIAPPRDDLLIVAHLAEPEAATSWAASRRFEVHPVVGSLQVFDVEEADEAAPPASGELFAAFEDDGLVQVGLPSPLLPAVRRLDSVEDLDALAAHLPPEAADGLYLLAAGYSLEDALAELTEPDAPAVDEHDFAVAVHHPQSQRSFLLLEEDEDLERVLSGSLEAWRVYLHPDQSKLVRMNARGPVRVLGGAGTGKTVALLHRAAHLLREVFVSGERILVTTYTKNLAADLGMHLEKMLTAEELERVDVRNLHGLASELWKRHGDERRVAWDTGEAWETALTYDQLGRSEAFYREEWEAVVQAQGISDERGYLRARRTGRGVALNRVQRRKVWTVFAAFRAELDERGQCELADVFAELGRGATEDRWSAGYAAALCDEAQDAGAPELRFLRAVIPAGRGDLFLVGDGHQRIYGRPVRFSSCGIEIRGRSRRLKVNYRTTARVRSWAVAALKGEEVDDLDGGTDSLRGYRSLRLGVFPRETIYGSRSEERTAIRGAVLDWMERVPPEYICVAAPTNRQVESLRELLEDADVPCVVLDVDRSDAGEGVRLATFHRMKGLEFPFVLLSHVEKGQVPPRVQAYYQLDDEEKARWDLRARCLLYVAATRARDELVVTGVGEPSPLL